MSKQLNAMLVEKSYGVHGPFDTAPLNIEGQVQQGHMSKLFLLSGYVFVYLQPVTLTNNSCTVTFEGLSDHMH